MTPTATPPAKTRATEAAYDAIEQLIATLQLEPNQPIVESDLIALTGLGRTPIREALMRLVARGLIEQQPRRGLRVSEIRIAEHLILIDTRRVLERLIATSSARRATPDQRAKILQSAQDMVAAAGRGDLAGYMQADQALDRVNHEACRNPYAVQAIVPMIIQCRRFWYAYQHEGDLERGAHCHLMEAEGIYANDAERAVAGADALMDYLSEFTHTVIEA
ncbi:GntR family transcriptional regulator [Castellaniella caeni]|uniref:GntR family transcriptional regulator n=1 Tax=Castellaniella caeni TaxID=266123 RepID=UPI00082F9311|nr:GntR family transcriptional regulator [Castellaniella caeni]